MNKNIQYELWQECNNHCTYCTLGRSNNCKTSDEMKLEAIKTAIKEIRNLSKGEVSALGFIGGEFFQGQLHNLSVKSAFMELVDVSNSLLSSGYINELWFNATLIDTDQSDLIMTIDRIENKDKLWILTSYDTKGRFHKYIQVITSNNVCINWCYRTFQSCNYTIDSIVKCISICIIYDNIIVVFDNLFGVVHVVDCLQSLFEDRRTTIKLFP